MTNSNENNLSAEADFQALFAELDPLESYDFKKEEIASKLCALLAYTNTTRTQFALRANWKKSRVTNVLNGTGNPTFKTLWEFAKHLGYEVDLHFRLANESPAKQPWSRSKPVYTFGDTHLVSSNYSVSKQLNIPVSTFRIPVTIESVNVKEFVCQKIL